MIAHISSGFFVVVMQDGVGGVIGAGPSGGETSGTASQPLPGGNPPAGGGQGQAASPFGSMMFPMLLGFLVLMVVTTMMSGRREKREKKNLLNSLSKHDKVQLSGGMIGTITEVKPDEVVVRVDESTKTTIRFVKSAVIRVIKSSGHHDDAQDESKEDILEPAAV